MASDNLNENYTTIVIHVKDVNDNPPVFDRPTYETQITEEDDRNLPKRVLRVNKETTVVLPSKQPRRRFVALQPLSSTSVFIFSMFVFGLFRFPICFQVTLFLPP